MGLPPGETKGSHPDKNDAAGKGGTIKAVTERVSPGIFRVVALLAPSDREKSQIILQRYMQHFPAAEEIVIFDRSWYNRRRRIRHGPFLGRGAQAFFAVCSELEKYVCLPQLNVFRATTLLSAPRHQRHGLGPTNINAITVERSSSIINHLARFPVSFAYKSQDSRQISDLPCQFLYEDCPFGTGPHRKICAIRRASSYCLAISEGEPQTEIGLNKAFH